MIKRLDGLDFDVVVGTESRGFIFGMPIAYALHAVCHGEKSRQAAMWDCIKDI